MGPTGRGTRSATSRPLRPAFSIRTAGSGSSRRCAPRPTLRRCAITRGMDPTGPRPAKRTSTFGRPTTSRPRAPRSAHAPQLARHSVTAVNDPPVAADDAIGGDPERLITAWHDGRRARRDRDRERHRPRQRDRRFKFGIVGVDTTGTRGTVAFDPGAAALGDETLAYSAPENAFRNLRAGATATDTFTYAIANADLDTPLALGERLTLLGDPAGAIVHFKNAAQAMPEHPDVRIALGTAYLEASNPDGALKELETARRLGEAKRCIEPKNRSGNAHARRYRGRGDGGRAQRRRRTIRNGPCSRALIDLGVGRFDEARRQFDAAAAIRPDDAEVIDGQVRAAIGLGDADGALAGLARLLEIDPDSVNGLRLKAELDRMRGNFEDARRTVTGVSSSCRRRTGRPVSASRKRISRRTIRTPPRKSSTRSGRARPATCESDFLRAVTEEQRGAPRTALRLLRSVVQRVPKHRDALLRMAQLHFSLGDYVAAEEHVERVLAIRARRHGCYGPATRAARCERRSAGRQVSKTWLDVASVDNAGVLALLGADSLQRGRDCGRRARAGARARARSGIGRRPGAARSGENAVRRDGRSASRAGRHQRAVSGFHAGLDSPRYRSS